jgi:hypothetical protein
MSMSQSNKADPARGARGSQDLFFRRDDAIWLTDVVARELKDKQSKPAAPKIWDKPKSVPEPRPTPPPARAASKDYRPTKIVPARPEVDDDAVEPAVPTKPRRRLGNLLTRRRSASATPARAPARKKPKQDRSDFIIGAMGLVLGLTCALFPWYIFFNQEQFGVREFVFSGEGGTGVPTEIAYQPTRVGQPFAEAEVPKMSLDFFPTATTPPEGGAGRSVPVSDQPFPADLVSYQLVHVANGRAMIMDDTGLWVVQPGSQLPDASRVASIEKRGDRWVIVTTAERVVELQP